MVQINIGFFALHFMALRLEFIDAFEGTSWKP